MIKKILLSLIPPIFKIIYFRIPFFNFKFYWKNISKTSFPKELVDITDKFIKSKSYKEVSNYWHYINISHYKKLSLETNSIKGSFKLPTYHATSATPLEQNPVGIDKFAVTLSLGYFTFLYPHDVFIKNTVKKVENNNINYKFTLFKKHEHFNYETSLNYNCILILLYENLKKLKEFNLLNKLNDKSFLGFSDPFIEIEGIKLTHDKINSLIDYHSISTISTFSKKNNIILEIGAGSGRVCDTILTFNKEFKYVICDIPPSIYVSYVRLKIAFPNKKISLCFDIKDNIHMMNSLSNSDILFIFPHQIEFFNKKTFDIFIANNCLHEMDKKTIKKYMSYVDIYSKYLYFKIWNKYKVPFSIIDNELSAHSKKNYSIKSKWQMIHKEKAIFPSNMYDFIYKID